MTAQADIVIKKANGTTDITFSKLAASGGDNSPAIWQSLTSGLSRLARHTLSATTKWNGTKSHRRGEIKVTMPWYDAGSGLVTNVVFTLDAAIPIQVPDTDLSEIVHQSLNLMSSSQVKSCFLEGYAPT